MYSDCKIYLHSITSLTNNYQTKFLIINLLKFTAQSLTYSNQIEKDTDEESTLYKSQH